METTKEEQGIAKPLINSRFSIIINDDDGKMSLKIIDYLTQRSAEISAEAISEAKLQKFSMGEMCELIVKNLKSKFREIVSK